MQRPAVSPDREPPQRHGPLAGVRIIELAGIGPAPMCCMLLADLGATVLRIDRPEPSGLGIQRPLRFNLLLRGRHTLPLDLKSVAGRDLVLRLVEEADALVEGFRPGVVERLGLGPDDCAARNPRLVFGRITGWGQEGPLAQAAGHDLNYIAVTGALDAIGRSPGPPAIPLNILGDYAGGALYLALGLLAAILEARQSGLGQVVDAAIVDGTASLMTGFHGLQAAGLMTGPRGTNMMDGGAPYYDSYECADGAWITVAPIEGKFYAELLQRLGLEDVGLAGQNDVAGWPYNHARLASLFRTRSRQDWCALLEGTDACFAPVLTAEETPAHRHLAARGTYVEIDGVTQPAPAPRFGRTAPETPIPPQQPNPRAALRGWLPAAELDQMIASNVP